MDQLSLESNLAKYVRVVAPALGPERLSRIPVAMLPAPQRGEGPTFWTLRPAHFKARHERYAMSLGRFVAQRYGIEIEHGEIQFVDLPDTIPGRIATNGHYYKMEIDKRKAISPGAVASVLAHEFAHMFLEKRAIRFSNTLENEQLTDATAVFAGFGPLMAINAERTKTRYYGVVAVATTERLGYLVRAEIDWLCCLRRRICNRDPFRVRSVIDPVDREFLSCPACRSKLRLPKLNAQILLKCPICSVAQLVQLQINASMGRKWWHPSLRKRFNRWKDRQDGIPI